MTKVLAQNINNIFRYREQIVTLLIIGILFSACTYAFLLHGAITNVVEREKISKETRSISDKVSELEANYFSVKNTIDIELAHAKGFKDTEISSFISKKSLTAMAYSNEL